MTRNGGLAHELEDEAFFEAEEEDFLEGEEEGEGFIGALGNVLGGLLGEGEEEEEHEHESEEEGFLESEDELFGEGEEEDFLEGEEEDESFLEGEDEWEGEGEAFFGGLKKLIRRAAPMLKQIAKVAAPIVGSAVGGPLGGKLASQAVGLLGEGELEDEDFLEGEEELEGEFELHEYETTLAHAATEAEAHAELMAAIASGATTEAEAEAMIGAATIGMLSARERRELRRVLAHLVRGSAILTRLLRRRRITRPAVRAVPLIVHQTAKTLTRQAASGRPVTRQQAGRVMARHTQRVLSSPRLCTKAIHRNAIVARRVPVSRKAIAPTARPAHPRLSAMRPAVARRIVSRPAYARPTQRPSYARPASTRAYGRPATAARRRY